MNLMQQKWDSNPWKGRWVESRKSHTRGKNEILQNAESAKDTTHPKNLEPRAAHAPNHQLEKKKKKKKPINDVGLFYCVGVTSAVVKPNPSIKTHLCWVDRLPKIDHLSREVIMVRWDISKTHG